MDGWIKFRKKLLRDGRVLELSRKCHTNRVTIIGALMVLWSLADDYGTDNGTLLGYTTSDIDREVEVAGFCQCCPSDWLAIGDNGEIILPEYHEHNGDTAKKRADACKRKRLSRSRSVTNMSHTNCDRPVTDVTKSCDQTVTREEKRREDNINPPSPLLGGEEVPRKKSWKTEMYAVSIPGVLSASPDFVRAWKMWLDYRSKRGLKLVESSVILQLEEMAHEGPGRAAAKILYTIKKGWQGLQEDPGYVEKATEASRLETVLQEQAARHAKWREPYG